MKESIENFLDRIYVNFSQDRVLVHQKSDFKGKPQIWTILKAKQYLNYLEQEEIVI